MVHKKWFPGVRKKRTWQGSKFELSSSFWSNCSIFQYIPRIININSYLPFASLAFQGTLRVPIFGIETLSEHLMSQWTWITLSLQHWQQSPQLISSLKRRPTAAMNGWLMGPCGGKSWSRSSIRWPFFSWSSTVHHSISGVRCFIWTSKHEYIRAYAVRLLRAIVIIALLFAVIHLRWLVLDFLRHIRAVWADQSCRFRSRFRY